MKRSKKMDANIINNITINNISINSNSNKKNEKSTIFSAKRLLLFFALIGALLAIFFISPELFISFFLELVFSFQNSQLNS